MEERVNHDGAILVIGHVHDRSIDDVHFDFTGFGLLVSARVVSVSYGNFILLAEILGDICVELFVVEVVFHSDVLQNFAACDFDLLYAAVCKERACFRIRIESVRLTVCKSFDACRRNGDVCNHVA
ncbi:unknown [Firmicutes bacterium CAG:475]|nr:unknown [Firmicutes bacterium CAG:475]